jgi:DNA-binding MarR family transcriptional regulator
LLTVQRRPEDLGQPECSLPELRVLSVLGRKEPVNMTDLAGALRIPLSTATRITDKLVRKKLVERRRLQKDQRVVEVAFSERGREINRFIVQGRVAAGRRLLRAMQPVERDGMLAGMSAILESKEPPTL